MAKFYFRLESLLKVAQNKVEEAEKLLGFCLRELKDGQEQLLLLSRQQTDALRSLVEGQKGKISINELISNHQYCQFLKAEVEKKQREVINLEIKVEEARRKLSDTIKQCKVLENLKEKQYQDFRSTEERSLQKELDQIASNLFYISAGGF